jgi:hypothetical protein
LRDAVQPSPKLLTHQHRIPLGLLLLSRQQITSAQLQEALALQQREPARLIGACLVELGSATERQVTAAVAAQWGCPVFTASLPQRLDVEIPLDLLRHYKMMPAHWNDRERLLHVGFVRRVDYLALAAIESLLDARAEACFISRSEYRQALSRLGEQREYGQASFAARLSTQEISEIAFGYAEQVEAEEIRVASTPEFLWIRMLAGSPMDLTFRLS